jgi:hypothetical protein
LLFGGERDRRFVIRTAQPEYDSGNVVLCIRGKAAHGRERLIEKFCHWWPGHQNFPFTICILSHILPREKLVFSPVGTSARRLSPDDVVYATVRNSLKG